MSQKNDFPCPCCSGKPYAECCEPFHNGQLPKKAEELMRSRYSAYALDLAPYIVQTTHPSNPLFQQDTVKWIHDIHSFCISTRFEKLEIIDRDEGEKISYVTFVAHLTQGNNRDNSFTEKSRFEKLLGKWFYLDGVILKGKGTKQQINSIQ